MSFSDRKRPFCSSPVVVLLIISLVHVWVSSQSQVGAIRMFPQRLLAVEEESHSIEPPPPGKNQTEIFREYFNGRVSDLNSTTNGTFLDYKRRIPSCPDPLHN
ncbi:hypothetical protein Pfo_009693 [Paulownia fortunei]|nr:hypothetical protein Pfo_009693 [Paulownia fortunei]